MCIEDNIVKIYFCHVFAAEIGRKVIDCHHFPEKQFQELVLCHMKEYSDTEGTMLYEYMKSDGHIWGCRKRNQLDVFYALQELAKQLLIVRDDQVKCRYEQIQRWRNLTRFLGEDLVVCAFLADWSCGQGKRWDTFQWPPVIGHTNTQLNAIMREGISENHFHLYGSAPVFQMIWIKLMNHVATRSNLQGVREIEKRRRMGSYRLGGMSEDDSVENMVLKAALIRAFLFSYMHTEDTDKNRIFVENEGIYRCLSNSKYTRDNRMKIQNYIDGLICQTSIEKGMPVEDYAQIHTDEKKRNYIFSGERQFLYEIFLEENVKGTFPKELANLFYAYLILKTAIRAEIVQVNETIGFENFSVYQKRKDYFLRKMDIQRMIGYAVGSTFSTGNIKMLEIRVTPSQDYKENARWIRMCDELLIKRLGISREQFYYVFHFPKRRDTYKPKHGLEVIPCRDALMRKKVARVGLAIVRLRDILPEEASRIKGIDACSQEIDCRPEVFAPTFRWLQNHRSEFYDLYHVKQLKMTYHVGEDFLDMVDGLRAIDEAICFLNFQNGDRLGHATVLGISPKDWYGLKHNRVLLAQQDHLDNVVWLYQKIHEYSLSGCDRLERFLLKEFEENFNEIFAVNMDADWINRLYMEHSKDERVGWHDMVFSIHAYYNAWKLRGDDPELYKAISNQKESDDAAMSILLGYHEKQEVVSNNDLSARILNYYYHYDWNVRSCGKKVKAVTIPNYYVEGVCQVQRCLQQEIGQRGIGIETNPSSNLHISTMNSYKEHPIIKLYNKGIENEENKDCPQLFVSINTDDKGVFYTSLENEYALMASALENEQDGNGRYRYNKQDVYRWIDNIRIMGNQQVFSADTGDCERR